MQFNPTKMTRTEYITAMAKKYGVSLRTAQRYLNGELTFPTIDQIRPWDDEGISRRTWYRRRRNHVRPRKASAT